MEKLSVMLFSIIFVSSETLWVSLKIAYFGGNDWAFNLSNYHTNGVIPNNTFT